MLSLLCCVCRVDKDKSNTITFDELVFAADEDTMGFGGFGMPSMPSMPEVPGGMPGMPGMPGFGGSNAREEVDKMSEEQRQVRQTSTHVGVISSADFDWTD